MPENANHGWAVQADGAREGESLHPVERKHPADTPGGNVPEAGDAKYRLMAERCNDGICLLLDGEIRYANEQAAAILGYRAEEILRSPLKERLHPDHLSQALAQKEKILSGRSDALRFESVMIRKDGSSVVAELSLSAIPISGKRGVLVFLRDITKPKQAEKTLLERESRFRELFTHMSSGVAVYSTNDNGKTFTFRDFNPAAERITRLRKKDCCNRSVADVFPAVEEMGLLGVLRDVWKTGRPRRHPLSMYQDDRLQFWVENYVYKLSTGEVVAVFDDVTDRQRAEFALRVSEQRLREAQRMGHLGDWELDIPTRRIRWSPEVFRLFHRNPAFGPPSPEEFLGYFVAQDARRLRVCLQRAETESEKFEVDLHAVLPNGRDAYYATSIHPQQDGKEPVTKLAGTIQDITPRYRLEQENRAVADRERLRIGRELHDDLGQRMTGISMLAECVRRKLLAEGRPEAADMEEVVRGLHEMNLRSRLLIHGLARGEIRAGDLPQSLEALAEDTRRMSGLECSFSHDGAQVENDQTATHLYRICQEAVNNAVRHARADRIRISLHHDPAGEHLCVEDNGVGMSLPTKTPEGQGLKIMNARSKIIGASLEIVPATGGGTRVLCRLPEGQILATGQDHDRYRPI